MKSLLTLLFLALGSVHLHAADKLNERDGAEESRMVEKDGKPPFNWVTKEEIFEAMTSPVAGATTVYLFSSAEVLPKQQPPFLGPVLHVLLCIESDAEGKVLGGVSYPLEYAMHFLSGEIREIEVAGGKLGDQAKVDFKGGPSKTAEYFIEGVLDLTLAGEWNQR